LGETVVSVEQVSKRFRLYHEKYTSLKERIIHAGRVPYEDLWALRDVSFEVHEGETVGILGRNGSGKSTLLKCICGVLQPTAGRVVVRGKLSGLLELGAGFQQELSGRDNIYLNGSMLGMSKKEIDRVFDDIVAFAELEQFIDNQVKFYSSGMYVRLGFAVAVNVDPDILVVDEVLAVGDERFQRKCMERIRQFQEEGRTILFVSHSPDQVRAICDRAVVLHNGAMVGLGSPGEMVRVFRETLLAADGPLRGEEDSAGQGPEAGDGQGTPAAALAPGNPAPGNPAPGSGVPGEAGGADGSALPAAAPGSPSLAGPSGATSVVQIQEVQVRQPGSEGKPFVVSGGPLVVRVAYQAAEAVPGAVVIVEIRDQNEGLLLRTDTAILDRPIDLAPGRGAVEIRFESFPFLDGTYSVVAGIANRLGGRLYDWREPACRFEVMYPGRGTGMVALPAEVVVETEAPAQDPAAVAGAEVG
jgi:ABC-type polysaccharide/polyol phosphate transport system ATPase subunit